MTISDINTPTLHPHSFYVPVRVKSLSETGCPLSGREERVPSSAILIIRQGVGLLTINNAQYPVSRGSVLMCSDSSQLTFHTNSKLEGLLIEYHCLTPDLMSTHSLTSEEPIVRRPLSCNPILQDGIFSILPLVEKFHSAWYEWDSSNPFQVHKLFITLLEEIHEALPDQLHPTTTWIDRILRYIHTHYNEELTREQMSELAGVSPEHFSRTFRRHTNQNFNTYVNLLRIRSAQKRLLTSNDNLNTIALEVGYREGSYLSRKFKQFIGNPPMTYQRKAKRIVAANFNHTASLRALGVTPELGVYSSWMNCVDRTPARYKLDVEIHNISSTLYEKIAVAQPDVIFSYNLPEDASQLLLLAPVIEIPFKILDWCEQFLLIADVIGQRSKAEKWLERYNERISEGNERLDQYIGMRGTAIVWEISNSTAYGFSSSFGRGCHILYKDLGFQMPALLREQGILMSGYIEVPIEALADFPADHIFITGLPSQPATLTRVHRLFQSPAWLQLDAVRNKRVHLLNQADMFYGFDPLSSEAQLHELLRVLTS